MKTSLIRKTIDSSFGNYTVECQSVNCCKGSIIISQMNDNIVIDESSISELIKHLTKLKEELDL